MPAPSERRRECRQPRGAGCTGGSYRGAQISSTTSGPGQGGTVTVTAMDSITIAGQDSFGNASGLFANAWVVVMRATWLLSLLR